MELRSLNLKYTTYTELSYQVIGPILDLEPDLPLHVIAKRLNDLGYRTSRGGLINPNSISWGLQSAFPDQRYRRRDKCSKISYSERNTQVNLKSLINIDPNGTYIEPTITSVSNSNYPKTMISIRDSDNPSSVSPKEIVSTYLKDAEAQAHWEQERANLELPKLTHITVDISIDHNDKEPIKTEEYLTLKKRISNWFKSLFKWFK